MCNGTQIICIVDRVFYGFEFPFLKSWSGRDRDRWVGNPAGSVGEKAPGASILLPRETSHKKKS